MKIQGLAVLAMIIIIPMSIILNVYSNFQIKTLDMQIEYDSRLTRATYDGIKSFQMNMSNSSSSEIVDSRIRDMTAAVKTFYNSLGSHFDMAGYGEDVLQEYVPAIVFTLYDGYYIYSSYDNQLDQALDENQHFYDDSTYTNGETLYGFKPYNYYSCRYRPNADSDFIITYSLDNYIVIQGKINGNPVNDSGYVLSKVEQIASGEYKYNGIEIIEENDKEGLKQNVYVSGSPYGRQLYLDGELTGSIAKYPYNKVNGTKYYKNTDTNQVFSKLNSRVQIESQIKVDNITQNRNGLQFYKEAYDFTNKALNTYNLKDLNSSDAVDESGNKYTETTSPYGWNKRIFDGTLEDENSNFNAHKMEVIKHTVETNLGTAIAQYNNVSTSSVNFVMPKLQDYEWETISKNVSMITFMQGLSIGGKVYNGHAIVQNTVTEEFVSENSIYILANDGQYRSPIDPKLIETGSDLSGAIGLFNTDFERRTEVAVSPTNDTSAKNIYYYPREDLASYDSIINLNYYNGDVKTIDEYFSGASGAKYQLAQIYYTALGRERYGQYRVGKNTQEVVRNAGLID